MTFREFSGDIISDLEEASSEYLLLRGKSWALYRKNNGRYFRLKSHQNFLFFDSYRKIVAVVNCESLVVFPIHSNRCCSGQEGLPGYPGIPGTDGPPGQVGTAGSPGTPGEKGDSGSDGNTGSSGSDGIPGKEGLPGQNGKEGLSGIGGLPGVRGFPGTNGSDGLPGITLDGIPGRNGVPGLNGSDGSDGIPGKNGSDGIPGPPGIDGLNGLPGLDGSNGSNGIPGMSGKSGQDGSDGFSGSDGTLGKVGEPGNPGNNGNPGNSGLPGDQGFPGTNGTNGLNGTSLPGDPGSNGSPGIPGLPGEPGIPGSDGFPGEPGPEGAPGIPGLNGLGEPGPPGYPGNPGAPGTNGSPGKSSNKFNYALYNYPNSGPITQSTDIVPFNNGLNQSIDTVVLFNDGIYEVKYQLIVSPDSERYLSFSLVNGNNVIPGSTSFVYTNGEAVQIEGSAIFYASSGQGISLKNNNPFPTNKIKAPNKLSSIYGAHSQGYIVGGGVLSVDIVPQQTNSQCYVCVQLVTGSTEITLNLLGNRFGLHPYAAFTLLASTSTSTTTPNSPDIGPEPVTIYSYIYYATDFLTYAGALYTVSANPEGNGAKFYTSMEIIEIPTNIINYNVFPGFPQAGTTQTQRYLGHLENITAPIYPILDTTNSYLAGIVSAVSFQYATNDGNVSINDNNLILDYTQGIIYIGDNYYGVNGANSVQTFTPTFPAPPINTKLPIDITTYSFDITYAACCVGLYAEPYAPIGYSAQTSTGPGVSAISVDFQVTTAGSSIYVTVQYVTDIPITISVQTLGYYTLPFTQVSIDTLTVDTVLGEGLIATNAIFCLDELPVTSLGDISIYVSSIYSETAKFYFVGMQAVEVLLAEVSTDQEFLNAPGNPVSSIPPVPNPFSKTVTTSLIGNNNYILGIASFFAYSAYSFLSITSDTNVIVQLSGTEVQGGYQFYGGFIIQNSTPLYQSYPTNGLISVNLNVPASYNPFNTTYNLCSVGLYLSGDNPNNEGLIVRQLV